MMMNNDNDGEDDDDNYVVKGMNCQLTLNNLD